MKERSLAPGAGERQILDRVDRGIRIGKSELRYQLERKDDHPLAGTDELSDVVAGGRRRSAFRSFAGPFA